MSLLQKGRQLIRAIMAWFRRPSIHNLNCFPGVHIPEDHDALSRGVEKLLDAGADINEIKRNHTMLAVAAYCGDIVLGSVLIQFGADLNECGGQPEFSPLYVSIFCEMYHFAFFLATVGARFGDVGARVPSVILYAPLSSRRPDVIKLVLDLIKDSNQKIHWEYVFLKTMWSGGLEACHLVFVRHGLLCFKDASFFNRAFYTAATAGYFDLMDMLIELRPQVLQAKWLVEQTHPRRLEQNTEYVAKLQELRSTPLSLSVLCIHAVRHFLQPNINEKVNSLELPEALKDDLRACVCQR